MEGLNGMLAAHPGRSNCIGRPLVMFFVSLLALCCPAAAQSITVVHSFTGADGSAPTASLLRASDGNFYGATLEGGAHGFGTVFQLTPGGVLTTIHNFAQSDGSYPAGALIEGSDSALYGMTNSGGVHNLGTVYRIAASGTLTTVYAFSGPDGNNPYGALLQGPDGNFYGMTAGGGAGAEGGQGGYGVVFQLTPSGKLTLLHSFGGQPKGDGAFPFGNLVYVGDGYYAGTTPRGGVAKNWGSMFAVNAAGDFIEPLFFDYTNGLDPFGSPILGADGNLYGAASGGGTAGFGVIYRVTLAGEETVLSNFGDGGQPYSAFGALVQASDGNFYGTSEANSNYGNGTIFEFSPATGGLTQINFNGANGLKPYDALIEDSSGNLWGTAAAGGANGLGEIFKLALPTPANDHSE
jgi:uncharacterized repeat protein (TIGR03803 family)